MQRNQRSCPQRCGLGFIELPGLQQAFGGFNLQTVLLAAAAALLLYQTFFSKPAKVKRDKLRKAKAEYTRRRAEILSGA